MEREVTKNNAPQIDIPQLEAWAREENWIKIDEIMGVIADIPAFILWAVGHIDDGNYNIRDLAASILEATSVELTETTRSLLEQAMFNGDRNKVSRFARFRA